MCTGHDPIGVALCDALGFSQAVTHLDLHVGLGEFITATITFYPDEGQMKAVETVLKKYCLILREIP